MAQTHKLIFAVASVLVALWIPSGAPAQPTPPPVPPTPLASADDPHQWVFAFKLNGTSFPTGAPGACLFGGKPQTKKASLAYAQATSDSAALATGAGLVGTSLNDPVGATFSQIYNGRLNFVVWNDQLYRHPPIKGCGDGCNGPWGHSKGVIAWDDQGNGVVLQVTTPSWPGSGTSAEPRKGSGNSLGCIVQPNNILYSQHFFALRLNPTDTASVLDALGNASVVTDITQPQLARIGGPPELQIRARALGARSQSTALTDVTLSTGIRLLSKPSALHVPPWQLVSAKLGGVPLRTATWWAAPRIPTTELGRQIICWRDDLGTPGRVEVALSGHWLSNSISLKGGGNHAKLGASLDPSHPYVVFGDLNQQGRLTGKCASSQNGRGGLFFVIEDPQLHSSITQLLEGDTAPLVIKAPSKKGKPK